MEAQNRIKPNLFFQRIITHIRAPLYRNGYFLILSSLATSGIGLIYWILAARKYSAYSVGVNSAVISAMTFLAGVSELNMMSALIRFLPTTGRPAKRFVITSYLVSLGISAAISVFFLKFLLVRTPALQFLGANPLMAAFFILSTMGWCIFVLQDSVLTGLRQASWVPLENIVFSLTKVVLMLVFASQIPVFGIFASWSFALIVAILPTNYFIFRKLIPNHVHQVSQENSDVEPRQIIRFIAADYFGALFMIICVNLMPLIVTTVVGATANAYFYLAWTITNVLYLIGPGMGSSLVVESVKNEQKLGIYSYRVFRNAMMVVIPAAVMLVIGAPYILMIFGKGYSSEGSTLLRLLALSAIPHTLNAIFVSVSRVQRRMKAVMLTLGSLCFMVLSISYALLKVYGIVGVGFGWVISQTLIAGFVFTTQLRGIWSKANKSETGMKVPLVSSNETVSLIHVLYKLTTKLNILPILTYPRKILSIRKRQASLSALLPEIINKLPNEICKSPQDNWSVHCVKNYGTNTTVAFLGSAEESPSLVLKLSGSLKDAESLMRHSYNLKSLNKEEQLSEWRRLLPAILYIGKVSGQLFSIERALPGKTLHTFLKDPKVNPKLLTMAVNEISYLHRITAHPTIIGENLLNEWVNDPICNLLDFFANSSNSYPFQKAIQNLGTELHTSLIGRKASISWVHGDYSPSNILVDSTGSLITGIVDWDLAKPNGLPLVDVMHLLLSVRMEMDRQELGQIVRDLLLQGNWKPEELQLIQDADSNLTGSPTDLRTILLLCWLWHINANLNKTSHYDHHNVWISENFVSPLMVL